MIAGTSPGSGKSTLMRGLAERFRECGQPVLEVDEDAVWGRRQLGPEPVDPGTAWPEFSELLHARPLGSQTPAEVLAALRP